MGKKLIFDIFGRFSMTKFTVLVSFIAWGEYVYSKHTFCINLLCVLLAFRTSFELIESIPPLQLQVFPLYSL